MLRVASPRLVIDVGARKSGAMAFDHAVRNAQTSVSNAKRAINLADEPFRVDIQNL